MSTSLGSLPRQTIGVESTNGTTGEQGDDPFTSTPQFQQPHPHRFSGFDSQLFALSHPTSSPSQAKRALEAHLAETERRLQDASKLGTTLIQQRKNISDRLRDVETRQGDGDIGPELRQKLINIEKEYNEVGRESARASLVPKIDMSVSPNGGKPPFALDGRVWEEIPCCNDKANPNCHRTMRVRPNLPVKLQIRPPRSTCQENSATKTQIPCTTLSSQRRLVLPYWPR